MTDDLIARLRGVKDWWRAPGHLAEQAARALEAQARRIAELQQEVCSLIRRDPDDDKDARIAELEEQVDAFEMDAGHSVARIAELKAALKPYTNGIVLPGAPDEQGVIVSMTVGDLRRARAALEKKND